uniref:Methyltransferase type 11 domain-containing protein n=1 Tax=Calcidiscus leptoporus TaxID=127549 RepID=A0A7S0P6H3_9EUKA|mmetsp:Transcript_603/g.1334  ORF Transcript_603/g.1334 Transcript_603/m.1334 type:complete len:318 (+) Transcript_603:76-1029(+)|eukprot:CAMPEP_0119360744 /NCGR_PEP_ID=MMETSP1334-20130426/8256_1 /TAXON_ID=127549 /ORGANISM="Calcidiscus leptoporus, Strain RCC1130" /LENGTH=317 /DNA_ID=CAMNT_0007375633 /DNA_START=71 /DNA_END=1024 /DNA_ORIENTATION=+
MTRWLLFAVAFGWGTSAAEPSFGDRDLQGASIESGFWFKWLASKGKRFAAARDYQKRTAATAQMGALLCDMSRQRSPSFARSKETGMMIHSLAGATAGEEVHQDGAAPDRNESSRPVRVVLDVGAGPLSNLGNRCGSEPVDLLATDALAPEYDHLLALVGLTPRVRTRYCPMEATSKCFARNFFDLVHSANALDHAQDPMAAVRAMVDVAKPGGYVVIICHVRERERQKASGMHQWNLYPLPDGSSWVVEGGNGSAPVNVAQALSGLIDEVHVSATAGVERSNGSAMGLLPKTWEIRARSFQAIMRKMPAAETREMT